MHLSAHPKPFLLLSIAPALLTACLLRTASAAPELVAGPLSPRSPASGTLFETLSPEKTGVKFINPIDTTHPWKFLYASSMSTGGVAIGDFDGDGRPDLFFAGGPGKNKLFRQTAPMTWSEDVWTGRFDDRLQRVYVARSIQGAYIRRTERSAIDLPARMRADTLARLGSLAKYLLAL